MVTAGNGTDLMNLKSTLTFFGYDSKYIIFTATRYTKNALVAKNIDNQMSLKIQQIRYDTIR